MPPFAVRKALRPLQPFIDKDPELNFQDFYKVIEDGLSFNGQVYALAYDLGSHHLYYNKDLFDAAGVPVPPANEPMTWEQFRDTATRLTKPEAGQYGYVIQPGIDAMVPWLWSGGGGYMNAEETESILGSPESVAAQEFVISMIAKDKIAAPVTDLANAQFASETFYSGKVGMVQNGPWNIVNVRKNAQFNWDIAPFPAGKAGSIAWVAGSGFGLSNTTKSPEEAWQALKVIASPASHEKLAKAGRGFPARQSALDAFKVPDQPPKNVDVVQKILNGQAGQVRPFRTTTTWQETVVMLTRDYNPVYLGQQSVQDTVAKVKPQFDELLKKHQDLLKR
jgi:multiple sugar transport system substrate-binding protein